MYICMSALSFGKVFSLFFCIENYHVYCKHAHSDWQNILACVFVIGKSNIMLTRTYSIVIEI